MRADLVWDSMFGNTRQIVTREDTLRPGEMSRARQGGTPVAALCDVSRQDVS
jgi:hypothetical protein